VDAHGRAELAFHFERSGDRVRAAIFARRAAEDALRTFAPDEAMDHFRAALRAIDDGDSARGDLLVGLGEAAMLAGERVRSTVAQHVYRMRGDGVYLHCSVVVASYPEDGQDRMALVNMADHAMYVAKKLGRNQVRSNHDQAFEA